MEAYAKVRDRIPIVRERKGPRGQLQYTFLPLGVALAAAFLHLSLWAQSPTPGAPDTAKKRLLTAGADDGYVDAQVCAGCHTEISTTFRQTGMGRSFARMTPRNAGADFSGANTYDHQASSRHYKAYQRDGKFFQRRHQVGSNGGEINVVEKEIHYVIGSGNHARSYLHRTPSGKLLQLPLTWYAEKGGYWAMSPGYDQPAHQGFRRAVDFECMACHNAYPEIEAGADAPGRTPVFPGRIPEGIDCQRCHGPGRAHVEALQNAAPPERIRSAIVNPARLSFDRELEVCMQCHLETTSRKLPHSIVRAERGLFSYRPGESLADFVLHFDHAPGSGEDDKFEVVQSVYRLRQSKCFIESAGAMTCATCHDPHHAPRGEEAAQHYSKACRNCHSQVIDGMIMAGKHPQAAECVSCHMPSRRAEDAVHSVMVDHLIQRRPPDRDLLAPLKEKPQNEETAYRGEVVPYYPRDLMSGFEGELYLAVAQLKDGADLRNGIPRLEEAIGKHKPRNPVFHFELGEAYLKAGRIADAITSLKAALDKDPLFLPAQKALGVALLLEDEFSAAFDVTKRALSQAPDDAEIHNTLGEIRYREGKVAEAAEHFQAALRLDPDFVEAHNNLGAARLLAGDVARAAESFGEAVRIKPEFAAAQANLAQAQAAPGNQGALSNSAADSADSIPQLIEQAQAAERANRLTEAAALYERILELRPDWPEVKLNLALVYYSQARYPDAIRVLGDVAENQPELTSALLFQGASYYQLNRHAEAVPLLEKYLSLEPGSDEVRPFLAAAYYGLKDYPNAALQYLAQIKLAPANAELYFQLGETYASLAGVLIGALEDQARQGPADARYYSLLLGVQQSLDQEDFSIAEDRLREAMALDPKNGEGRLAHGYLLLARGDPSAAKADFEDILTESPAHCRALQGLANAEMSLGNQETAAAAIETLSGMWPACLTYTVGRSREEEPADFTAGGDAVAACRQAVSARSFAQDAASGVERTIVMASCLERRGAIPAATATLLTVLDGGPRSRYLASQILLRLAEKAYKRLARLAPASPLVSRLRAQELERQGNLDAADAEFLKALSQSGSDIDALVIYAQFKARIGRLSEAAPILEQVLRRSPVHPRANAMLGDVYLASGEIPKAVAVLRRAVEANPSGEAIRRKLAIALERDGRLEEAIQVLEDAPTDSDGQIHFSLGNYYRRIGAKEKAIEALRLYQERRKNALAIP